MNPSSFAWSRLVRAAAAGCLVGSALLAASVAVAGTATGGFTRNSKVTDAVIDNGNGTWDYQYTVHNTSIRSGSEETEPVIVDWELPWFGDAGITAILSPHNWTYSIERIGIPNAATGWAGVAAWQDPSDPFYAGAASPYTSVQEVLHWYNLCWVRDRSANFVLAVQAVVAPVCDAEDDLADAIRIDNELSGFGFTANFGPTGAPYQASWANLPVRSGDPAFPASGLPNSPALQQRIPEPAPLLLLALAGGGLWWRMRRRG